MLDRVARPCRKLYSRIAGPLAPPDSWISKGIRNRRLSGREVTLDTLARLNFAPPPDLGVLLQPTARYRSNGAAIHGPSDHTKHPVVAK